MSSNGWCHYQIIQILRLLCCLVNVDYHLKRVLPLWSNKLRTLSMPRAKAVSLGSCKSSKFDLTFVFGVNKTRSSESPYVMGACAVR